MYNKLLCSLALGIMAVPAASPRAFAQTANTHIIPTIHNSSSLLLVSVKLNGKGPYEFLLDTASAMTLLDASLYKEVALGGSDALKSRVTEQDAASGISSLKEVQVGDVHRQDLQVVGVENLAIGDGKRHVRGVLGENFLRHFDLLIDNVHDVVMLDEGTGLIDTYGGERLPMTLGQGDVRPAIQVAVNSFDAQPMRLVLNSGTNAVGIYPEKGAEWKVRAVAGSRRTAAVSGSDVRRCTTWKDKLDLGSARFSGVDVYACDGITQDKADAQGNLPTSIFSGVLISHSKAYVIVNPVKQGGTPLAGMAAFVAIP